MERSREMERPTLRGCTEDGKLLETLEQRPYQKVRILLQEEQDHLPYLTRKPTPRSKLDHRQSENPISEEGAYSCSRPKGVKISAPSLYVQVFKKLSAPEADN